MFKSISIYKKIVFILSTVTFILTSSLCFGAIYYVDATKGNDSYDGLSPSTAWKTIKKINESHFRPSDHILFKKGESWREQLTVPSSGSKGSPIVIGAYGNGAAPLITGFQEIRDWRLLNDTYEASGVYKSDHFPSAEIGVVLVDGNILLKYNPDATSLSEGEFNHNSNEGLLTIKLLGNENPSEHIIEAAIRNSCIISIGKSYIVIENLHLTGSVKGVHLTANDWPVLDVGSNYNIVRNNLSEYHGEKPIKLTASSNNVIIGNTIRFAGGAQHPDYAAIGIQLDAGADGNPYGSNNNIIEKNNIISSEDNGILIRDSNSNIIRWNFLFRIMNFHGIQNKDSDETIIYYNVIESGPQGSATQVEDGSLKVKIFNNTMPVLNGKWGLKIIENSTGTVVKNNITINGRFRVDSGSETNLISDHNLIYRSNGNLVTCLGTNYTMDTFSIYQRVTGQDTHSILYDPLFIDTGKNNYQLKPDSPAINSGAEVGLTEDIQGSFIVGLPDIGAYEYLNISAPRNLRIESSISIN